MLLFDGNEEKIQKSLSGKEYGISEDRLKVDSMLKNIIHSMPI
jgi:hypothetical protein